MRVKAIEVAGHRGTQLVQAAGHTWLVKNPGTLSMATTLLSDEHVSFSWAFVDPETRGLHVRVGGLDPFARDGRYLGLVTDTDQIKSPEVRALAEAAMNLAERAERLGKSRPAKSPAA